MPELAVPYRRPFGVEIECGFPGSQRQGMDTARELMVLPEFNGWHLTPDGTTAEFDSPILRGRDGFTKLRKVYAILKRNGAYVTEADGMHVHLDASDYPQPLRTCLFQSWYNQRVYIEQMVSKRRRSSSMCYKWTLAELRRGYPTGYKDIRYRDEHGTFEVRLHEGILHYPHVRAWVMFLQRMVHQVKHEGTDIPPVGNEDELFRRINVSVRTAAILKRKMRYYAENEPDNIRQDNGYPEGGGGPWG